MHYTELNQASHKLDSYFHRHLNHQEVSSEPLGDLGLCHSTLRNVTGGSRCFNHSRGKCRPGDTIIPQLTPMTLLLPHSSSSKVAARYAVSLTKCTATTFTVECHQIPKTTLLIWVITL
jgi:hypothetical protein